MSASDPPAELQQPDARERLRQHFLNDRTTQRWDDLWKDGSFLPWDKGTPNPALIEALDTHVDSSTGSTSGSRKRALVPGCGKGYDVYLLAAYGYDAYGLEGSNNAVQAAEGFRSEALTRKEYAPRNMEVGEGAAKFVFGDFYKKEWEETVGGARFDVIYDYTFLCAMPPDLRPAWSKRMAELLAPGGILICLEFPTYKEPSTGGPPWALRPETYEMLLPFPGEGLKYDDEGYVVKEDRPPNLKGLTRVAHWQPERTHDVGKGTDWISLWKHLS